MSKLRLQVNKRDPMSLPILIAYKKGFWQPDKVELIVENRPLYARYDDFYRGKVDGMIGNLTDYFYLQEQGKMIQIVESLASTIALVGRDKTVIEKREYRIGSLRSDGLLFWLDQGEGKRLGKVEISWYKTYEELVEALKVGKCDAIWLRAPFTKELIQIGYEVWWESKAIDAFSELWLFDLEFANKDQEAIKGFGQGLEEGMIWFNGANGEEKVKMSQKEGEYSLEQAWQMRNFYFEKRRGVNRAIYEAYGAWLTRQREIYRQYSLPGLIG